MIMPGRILSFAFACALTIVRCLAAEPFERYTEKVPGTLVTFEMLPVPAGTFELAGKDGTQRRITP